MNDEQEFAKLKTEAEPEETSTGASEESADSLQIPPPNLAEFLPFLTALRRPKAHLTGTPQFVPKTFAEQIQFVDFGLTSAVYFYINGAWYFIELTEA